MIDSNFRARICDFGLSKIVGLGYKIGTPDYMAPELRQCNNPEQNKNLNLFLCDVYSYGILVNEVIFYSKPSKDSNQKPLIKLPENVQEPFLHSAQLVKLCTCCDDPSKRPTFRDILDKETGLLRKIRRELQSSKYMCNLLYDKIVKKTFPIDFTTFWKKFLKIYGKEKVEKGYSFIQILFTHSTTQHNDKVSMRRICDWLQGVDPAWIAEGYLKSFFVHHYVGEKTQKDVEADVYLFGDLPKGKGKCQAVLYWDDSKDQKAFYVTVRYHERTVHHKLDTKSIDRLQKVIQKKLDTQNETRFWVASTLFQSQKQKTGYASQMFTADAGASKFASIYVY